MTLKELKTLSRKRRPLIELLSHEGDIYLCQVEGEPLLSNRGDKPLLFHSIFEAKGQLGRRLSSNMQLACSRTYDEMI